MVEAELFVRHVDHGAAHVAVQRDGLVREVGNLGGGTAGNEQGDVGSCHGLLRMVTDPFIPHKPVWRV